MQLNFPSSAEVAGICNLIHHLSALDEKLREKECYEGVIKNSRCKVSKIFLLKSDKMM